MLTQHSSSSRQLGSVKDHRLMLTTFLIVCVVIATGAIVGVALNQKSHDGKNDLVDNNDVSEPQQSDLMDIISSSNPNRILQMDEHKNHMPLMCNQNIASCTTKSFSTLLSSMTTGEPLVVPCGECYEIDIADGSTITLPDGLRIEGKLSFPSTSNVVIRTRFVFVLGFLDISVPDEGNQVKFSLYGEEMVTFTSNIMMNPCVGGCGMGSKVIAVLGGKLNIQGYDSTCPAWEKLEDVGPSSPRPFSSPCDDSDSGNCDLSLEIRAPCSESETQTQRLGRRTILCPIEQTITVSGGDRETGYTITSLNPRPPPEFVMPTGLVLNKKSACVQDLSITTRCMLQCPITSTVTVTSGDKNLMTFTSVAGQTYNVDEVKSWARSGTKIIFYPDKDVYSPTNCIQAAAEFNTKFPDGSGINVSYRVKTPVPSGQTITASGVLYWAFNGFGFYFFSDTPTEEINTKFPVGYRMKVDYTDLANDLYKIKVSPEAAKCWNEGNELLLTSHTRNFEDEQVVTVASSDPNTGIITLTNPIEKPITKADSTEFAIEVASLNRKVVFEAESDNGDKTIGGHFIVHHTSQVQHIEGVEIRNFGQQGSLGRYPLHFHHCGSNRSWVKKNVVRDSNQRCYVVHGTNDVTLEDNVAHGTFGHCYFLEDGTETGNTFIRNLAAGGKDMPLDKLALLSAKSGRIESDDKSSQFWISHAQNAFYGNVAAGGQSRGYWFETPQSDAERQHSNLIAFEDNEVHSQQIFGFTTYSPGWTPSRINVIKNLKSYRNNNRGANLRRTRNLVFDGGVFADNGDEAVVITFGDNLVFQGTKFIGKSPFMEDTACSNIGLQKVGILLHPVRLAETVNEEFSTGTTLIDTEFMNWSNEEVGCPDGSRALKFHSQLVRVPAFSAPHKFVNIKIQDTLDACMDDTPEGQTMDDVILEVVQDDNMSFSSNENPGFLVSPKVATMLPTGACIDYNLCLQWCEGVCLRTISVLAGDNSMPKDIVMKVRNIGTSQTITIERDLRDNVQTSLQSVFTVALPKGNFEVHFEDSIGNLVWPQYAAPFFEEAPACWNHIIREDLTFIQPIHDRPECDDLILNGSFDSSIDGWMDQGAGIDFFETGDAAHGGALRTTIRTGDFIYTFLDVTCIQAGDVYDVEISYLNVDQNSGTIKNACLGNSNDCPWAQLNFLNFDTVSQTFGNSGFVNIGTTTLPYNNAGGWNFITGTWTVTDTEGMSDQIRLKITGGTDELIIDNVSLKKRVPAGRNLRNASQ